MAVIWTSKRRRRDAGSNRCGEPGDAGNVRLVDIREQIGGKEIKGKKIATLGNNKRKEEKWKRTRRREKGKMDQIKKEEDH